MAGSAKVACTIEVLHHSFGVTVKVCQDVFVGNFTVDRLAILIHHHCRLSEHPTSRTVGIDLLDGMADRAGDAIRVEDAIHGRVFG